MASLGSIAAVLTIALTHWPAQQQQGWKGIIPLHSTRADVERLLGLPPYPPNDGMRIYTPNPDMPLYFLGDQDVRIGYMTDAFADRMHCSSYPIGTVIGVVVEFRRPPLLSDLGIDERKFDTFDPSTPQNIGFKAYVDIEDGVFICTEGGKVHEIGYFGDAKDRRLCPELTRDPKKLCSVLVDFSDGKEKPKKPRSD